MTRADLLALAARVEAAAGADREMDVAIARAVDAEQFLGHAAGMSDAMLAGTLSPCPRFTASLDAAASLVPAGWSWEVSSDGGAILTRDADDIPLPDAAMAASATPALALCAAALRAMAEEASDD